MAQGTGKWQTLINRLIGMGFHNTLKLSYLIGQILASEEQLNSMVFFSEAYLADEVNVFDIHMSVHHEYNSKLQPTRCNVS